MVGYTKFNRPIDAAYKNFSKRKRVMKQVKKKNKGVKIIPVADPELITSHILKKRGTNPRANITLSGKKRNKILKRLRRKETEGMKMQVEPTVTRKGRKVKKSAKAEEIQKNKQTESFINDVEMKE
ncbi:uncharacterized protein C11orf98-like [Styela clava]